MRNGLPVNCLISVDRGLVQGGVGVRAGRREVPGHPDPVHVGVGPGQYGLSGTCGTGLMTLGFHTQITLLAPARANRSWMCRQAATNCGRGGLAGAPRVPVAVHLVPEAERDRHVERADGLGEPGDVRVAAARRDGLDARRRTAPRPCSTARRRTRRSSTAWASNGLPQATYWPMRFGLAAGVGRRNCSTGRQRVGRAVGLDAEVLARWPGGARPADAVAACSLGLRAVRQRGWPRRSARWCVAVRVRRRRAARSPPSASRGQSQQARPGRPRLRALTR